MIMKSLLWNCVIEAQKYSADPMVVPSISTDGKCNGVLEFGVIDKVKNVCQLR